MISMVKKGARGGNSCSLGRPTKLSPQAEAEIRKWLEECAKNLDFPTKREFEQKCADFLDAEQFQGSFSKNYFDELLKRIAPDFDIRLAQPVEFERGFLSEASIKEYFETLNEIDIEHQCPDLILNFDETGFGGSRSGRMRSMPLIVPQNYDGKLRYQDEQTSHHISALIGISASGNMLTPGIVIPRESEHPDGSSCQYFNKAQVYYSTKGFITRSIFEEYFSDVVIPYINQMRTKHGDQTRKAIIIYDGLKGHISEDLFAYCADNNVEIVVLPPHSSHLLQPLDQGLFRSMKSHYPKVADWAGKSKLTTKLQKIFTACEMCDNHQLIIKSWSHSGIEPVIINGEVTSVKLCPEKVLKNSNVQVEEGAQINEKARGRRRTPQPFGLLNAEQIARRQNGLCAFCGHSLQENGPIPDHTDL